MQVPDVGCVSDGSIGLTCLTCLDVDIGCGVDCLNDAVAALFCFDVDTRRLDCIPVADSDFISNVIIAIALDHALVADVVYYCAVMVDCGVDGLDDPAADAVVFDVSVYVEKGLVE